MPTTAPDLRVGDIGTELVVVIVDENGDPVAVQDATLLQITLRRLGTTAAAALVKTAVLDGGGADGKIKYVTVAGDLAAAGMWEIQGKVTVGGATWSSRPARFAVGDNLT